MDAIECIRTRRSTRKYSDAPLTRETLEAIVGDTVYAPSWKNTQVVRYTFCSDKATLQTIADNAVLGFAFNAKTITRCTVLAVQSVVKGISGFEPDGSFSTPKKDGWEMYDAGISAQTFCLAAHARGVKTVILGVVDDEKVREILGIPDTESVTALIAMGYSEVNNPAPPRKTVDEVARFL